jgi:hypothetical protein
MAEAFSISVFELSDQQVGELLSEKPHEVDWVAATRSGEPWAAPQQGELICLGRVAYIDSTGLRNSFGLRQCGVVQRTNGRGRVSGHQ